MENLSCYRLPNHDDKIWMVDAMRKMGFWQYIEFEKKVFHALDVLKVGKYYDIARDVKEEQQELFIKISCLYIQKNPSVVFSDDYTKIKKEKIYEQRELESIKHRFRH